MPGTAAELAEKTGLAEERVREVAERLMKRGALAHPMKKPDLYRLFPAMIELRDATVLWPDAPQELFELWEELVSKEMLKLIPMRRRRVSSIWYGTTYKRTCSCATAVPAVAPASTWSTRQGISTPWPLPGFG